MKVKLQSGQEIVIKDLSVDERDELLDEVVTETDGENLKIKVMHSTIRMGVEKADEKFIKSLTFSDKTEIFQKMQGEYLNLGEGKASK